MSHEGYALQLPRACNVSPRQMIQFLQPFQGRLPTTEAEFQLVTSHMRRVGHILESAPNNLGQLLRGRRQARPGEYLNLPEGGSAAGLGAGGARPDEAN
eukprot:5167637-Alexandrium_andersonii.AAC.1